MNSKVLRIFGKGRRGSAWNIWRSIPNLKYSAWCTGSLRIDSPEWKEVICLAFLNFIHYYKFFFHYNAYSGPVWKYICIYILIFWSSSFEYIRNCIQRHYYMEGNYISEDLKADEVSRENLLPTDCSQHSLKSYSIRNMYAFPMEHTWCLWICCKYRLVP